jgi:hypothetical protein
MEQSDHGQVEDALPEPGTELQAKSSTKQIGELGCSGVRGRLLLWAATVLY